MSRSTTAAAYGAVSVSTVTKVVSASGKTTSVSIQPTNGDIYVGPDASVTTANGIKVTSGSVTTIGDHMGDVYAIASSGTVDVRYWRQG
jgi:hypothetical protein